MTMMVVITMTVMTTMTTAATMAAALVTLLLPMLLVGMCMQIMRRFQAMCVKLRHASRTAAVSAVLTDVAGIATEVSALPVTAAVGVAICVGLSILMLM